MLLKLILAVLLPPVAVFLSSGIGITLIINIVLTLIGWLPGVIHALWVVTKQAEKADA
jgi:uncharacterized membrane protein YqaE (UPF0057 family)